MRWLFLAKNISDFVFTEIHKKKHFKENLKIFMKKKMQKKRKMEKCKTSRFTPSDLVEEG